MKITKIQETPAPTPAATDNVVIHVLQFQKTSERQLNELKTRAALDKIAEALQTKDRVSRGWQSRVVPANRYSTASEKRNPNGRLDTDLIYTASIEVRCALNVERTTLAQEWRNIVSSAIVKAAPAKWVLTSVDGEAYIPPSDGNGVDEVGYAPIEIPVDWNSYFEHLYGLDAHISRVKRALDAGTLSNWTQRFHVALAGPPGCGKSDICRSLKNALGEEAVLEFDATSTTSAGALKYLAEVEELPRIMVVEEIEKAKEDSLQWLLAIMDMRAEVRKRTARGNIDRSASMLVIATVNNLAIFEKVMSGALASRFSNKIFFDRPSRETLERILLREIETVQGDPAWVTPALDFAEELGIDDPREIISHTLCGRDDLITGVYQAEVRSTGRPKAILKEEE